MPWAFINKWWLVGSAIAGGLVTGGAWINHVEAELERRATQADVAILQHDVDQLTRLLDEMNVRQQQFYCDDKPKWCR